MGTRRIRRKALKRTHAAPPNVHDPTTASRSVRKCRGCGRLVHGRLRSVRFGACPVSSFPARMMPHTDTVKDRRRPEPALSRPCLSPYSFQAHPIRSAPRSHRREDHNTPLSNRTFFFYLSSLSSLLSLAARRATGIVCARIGPLTPAAGQPWAKPQVHPFLVPLLLRPPTRQRACALPPNSTARARSPTRPFA